MPYWSLKSPLDASTPRGENSNMMREEGGRRERGEVKPPRVCSCDVIVQRDGAGYRYYKFRARRAMRLLIIASFGKVSCPDQLCNLLVARRRYETL